jgi:hypothetical protein
MSKSLKDCIILADSIEVNQNGFLIVPSNLGLAEFIWGLKSAISHAVNFRELFMSLKMKNEGYVCLWDRAKPGEAVTSMHSYCDDCPVEGFCWKDKHFSK